MSSSDRYQELLGLVTVIVTVIVSESGEPAGFDAARWLDDWLHHPVPALGKKLPIDYLDSDAGCELLVQLLRQMQSGAYA
ncbi:MbcA/ParS/Xre antitoxin family protein [Dyella sp. EPa41]|uniref:MbcA/ParS/Xre antitoxin family protein n=1 Tax=Dyella sp. EPa41 TaxID=1561194 RepID=UPI0019164D29|nr:MbcA/ParS/Xre antitoxin family protein [Dyella sp. EPa41]